MTVPPAKRFARRQTANHPARRKRGGLTKVKHRKKCPKGQRFAQPQYLSKTSINRTYVSDLIYSLSLHLLRAIAAQLNVYMAVPEFFMVYISLLSTMESIFPHPLPSLKQAPTCFQCTWLTVELALPCDIDIQTRSQRIIINS